MRCRPTGLIISLVVAILSSGASAEMIYHRGNEGDPETLDQHKTSTVSESHILRDLYEGMIAYDPEGNVGPGVATDWSISTDGLTYTFNLRRDAKWSNGDPVTADDFVYSYRRIMTPETAASYANILYPVKNAEAVNRGELPAEELGVTALDDYTVQIELENPTPFFVQLLTHSTSLPVHRPSIEAYGTDFVRPENMVSNGAYQLAEFIPNGHTKVVKNPYFHDAENVVIDAVYFYPTEDKGAALRRFMAGELHSNGDAPVEQIAFMREALGDQLRIAPYLGNYYYTVNTTKAPFSDRKIRRALSLLIDREFLAEEIWGGAMLPGYSLVPPGTDNYPNPPFADYKDMSMLDREDEAAQILADAGFNKKNPLLVEIKYNTSENHKNTAIAIASMWKPFNIKVRLLNSDAKTHYANLRIKIGYDVARAGWIGDYSDPYTFLYMLESTNDGFNYANYVNTDYDALLRESSQEVDLEKRAQLLRRAEEMILEDVPFIPILYYSSINLVSPKLQGWVDNVMNAHPSRFLRIED